MSNHDPISTSKIFEQLQKLGTYLVGLSIVCYGAGFAITNLYLGSMGIVTFDILRTRYILAGLLFILFLGAIVYLVGGHLKTLKKNIHLSRMRIIGKVLDYAFLNYGLLIFAISAISLFAGASESHPFTLPHITQPEIPWSEWLFSRPPVIFRTASTVFGIGLLSLPILFIGIFIVNPKGENGARTPRAEYIKKGIKLIKSLNLKVLSTVFGLFLFCCLFLSLIDLVSFYLGGGIQPVVHHSSFLPQGWNQYLAAILLVYSIPAVYLTMVALFPVSPIGKDDFVQPVSYSWILLIAIGISVIVPIYAVRVYPNLPQQIGGGQLIDVQISLTDSAIEPLFSDPNIETYLIDRTSSTSFFLLQNETKSKYKIIEIQNDFIQCITYSQSLNPSEPQLDIKLDLH